jgi:membrane-associated phospholipid phosphatase
MSTTSGVLVSDGVPRQIGVSPALTKVNNESWFRGYKWPPADAFAQWTNSAPTQFPRAYWGPSEYATVVLGEFVEATAPTTGYKWNSPGLRTLLKNILDAANVQTEIGDLVELIEYRPGVMAEALAQRTNPWAYFRGILMTDAPSAPYTRELVEIAVTVGHFQVQHYKREFNRVRPSQISPALLPPIDIPGHAAFPSGHATEGHMIAYCLTEVMPAAARTPAQSPLMMMAQRIARNREVLGLHYPSDSAAGKLLAEKSFEILMQCPSVKNEIIPKAKAEWWS